MNHTFLKYLSVTIFLFCSSCMLTNKSKDGMSKAERKAERVAMETAKQKSSNKTPAVEVKKEQMIKSEPNKTLTLPLENK